METKEWFQKSKRFLNKEQILMQKKTSNNNTNAGATQIKRMKSLIILTLTKLRVLCNGSSKWYISPVQFKTPLRCLPQICSKAARF